MSITATAPRVTSICVAVESQKELVSSDFCNKSKVVVYFFDLVKENFLSGKFELVQHTMPEAETIIRPSSEFFVLFKASYIVCICWIINLPM